MVTTINGIEEFKKYAGKELGYSDWRVLEQAQVDLFADATDDHQWIHVDPERAASGPFGGTIADGYLTLSLVPSFMHDILDVQGMRLGVNYGANRVRFPTPLKVGAKARLAAKVGSIEDVEGGVQVVLDVSVEVEGQEKPACVAQVVYRYYD